MMFQSIELLSAMRLPGMKRELLRQMETPAMDALSFEERIEMMVAAEWTSRVDRKLARLLKEAKLKDPSACLENVDFRPQHNIRKEDIARLSTLNWVRQGRNLLITGKTGTGKTYLACAFGNAVCREGKKVRSYKTHRLLTELAIGAADGTYTRILEELKKPDLLILEDFGMTPISADACRNLLEVIDDRHGFKSILVTAQLPVAEWHGILEDKTAADAIMDRLISSALRLEPKGPSMRTKQSEKGISDLQDEVL